MKEQFPTFFCNAGPNGWSYRCAFCHQTHTHKPGPGIRAAHCPEGTPLYLVPIQIELAPAAKAEAQTEINTTVKNDRSLALLLKSTGLSKHPLVISAIVAASRAELLLEAQQL